MGELKRVPWIFGRGTTNARRLVQATSPHWDLQPPDAEGIVILHDKWGRYDVDDSLDVNITYFPGFLVLIALLLALIGGFFAIRLFRFRRRSA